MEQVPTWVSMTQIGASIFLGLAALTVAIVSLYVAYRNNFGWKPIVLITEIGIKGVGGEHKSFTATLAFEIWNRRKYPVTVREITVQFENLKTHRPQEEMQKPWYYGPSGSVSRMDAFVIAPTSHETKKVEIGFTTPSLDSMNAPVTIRIYCFDPRRSETDIIVVVGAYTFKQPEPLYA